MIKKMTPPTILKLLTEISKNLKSNYPENAKIRMVINETIEAFLAVLLRFAVSSLAVIVMKIGIVPRGFTKVKNDVKQSNPNVISSFMCR